MLCRTFPLFSLLPAFGEVQALDVVVGAAENSEGGRRKRGKDVRWSYEENISYCDAESAVSENSARGSSMTAAAYARRIHAAFACTRQKHACTA